ncbi:hypothetical protein B0T40_16525 [Chromobacterium haemolyticum]|uniref:DUF1120 domain-containing protein n=1 Tax=Chromobacterium haemolyticum TaxID=394935 RepID=UPI0009D9FF1C|nr:DUF1120 domain-containing protein [Chromobacterium haemolyticum]OQS33964.1 hypothetical protein B0T40_16525 [Chromobacterium haemolyticum]
MKLVVASSALCVGVASASDEVLGSTQFEVKGSIVPTACSVVFSGGGVFDYGVIDRKELNGSDGYLDRQLENIQPFAVTCEAPTKLNVRFVDNRVGTAVGGADDDFGLGLTSKGEKFGNHYFSLSNSALKVFEGESENKDVIYGVSKDGQSGWGKEQGTFVVAGGYYSPIDKNSLVPVAFARFESAVNSRIKIKRNLKVTDREEFSGLVTLELDYINQ